MSEPPSAPTVPSAAAVHHRRRLRAAQVRRAATASASVGALLGGLSAVRFGVEGDALRHVVRPTTIGLVLGVAAAAGLGRRAALAAKQLRSSGGRFLVGEFLLVLTTCAAAGAAAGMAVAAFTLPTWRDRAFTASCMFVAGFAARFVGKAITASTDRGADDAERSSSRFETSSETERPHARR